MFPNRNVLLVVGATGNAQAIFDAITATNADFAGFVSFGEQTDGLKSVNWRLDGVAELEHLVDEPGLAPGRIRYLVASERGDERLRIAELMNAMGYQAAHLIHPSAEVGTDIGIGPGVFVDANSVWRSGTTIEAHTHVGPLAVVHSDIGEGCDIGSHAGIHAAIGRLCTVAPGAQITHEVRANSVVGGPAIRVMPDHLA